MKELNQIVEKVATCSHVSRAPLHLENRYPQTTRKSHTSRLNPDLQGRHMQMIVIGGAIGTGLFIGSGSALATGGPAALLIGFGIDEMMLFCVIHALGELAIMFPIAGDLPWISI
jgi:amino acid permease